MQRDLTHPDGGFFSAEDADSAADAAKPKEKSEGAFYVWSREEIEEALGRAMRQIFCDRYGVKAGGQRGGRSARGISRAEHFVPGAFDRGDGGGARIERGRSTRRSAGAAAKLLERRARRPRPHLDDKILAGWNGLMISAFAKGAQVLGEARYADAARAAANFLRRAAVG